MKGFITGFHLYKLLMFLKITVIVQASFVSNKFPLWSWECVNERCVPTQAKNVIKMQSLPTCNMLCASLQLWPQPTGAVSLSATAVPVRADLFHLQIPAVPSKVIHEHLLDAFQLFRDDLKYMENKAKGFAEWRAVAVYISVNGSVDPRMLVDTDESYTLQIGPRPGVSTALVVEIFSSSFCGAVHGLQTLLQLVWLDPYMGTLLALEAAKVVDAPKFRYRGLMLDTARNFYPINDLMRTIDAMAACKLNTFHWHISDSQSFSLKLTSVPQLSQNGAYGPATYNTEDVRMLVKRARLRGIRVIIEIDAPAHVGRAWSWGKAGSLGELVHCLEAKPWTDYCHEPPCGQLNPYNPHVFEILEAVYGEIIHLTGTDDIFHLGGDEISKKCWEDHFKDSDPVEIWQEFTRTALQRLEIANGKLPNITIMWTSHLSKHIKTDMKDYVHSLALQARNKKGLNQFVNGIRTIISDEDKWDLNNGLGEWYEENGGALYNSWQRVYEYRGWSRGSMDWIEGGEATVWSSTLSPGDLDSRIWPRAAALAERLWSDRAEGATRPVHARLDVHRSRLVARGIQAAPLWSMWCTQNTFSCL